MKKLFGLLIGIIIITYWGCGKDDSNPIVGPSDVTFRMSHIGSGDAVYFQFKPSENIKLDTIIASCAAKQFTDTYIVSEPERIFQKEVLYQWIAYSGVNQGQKWNFTFKGRLASTNSTFSYITSYMVP